MGSGDIAVVATERLNLRSGPGSENRVVRELPDGTVVKVLQVEDGWAQVELQDDTSVRGWSSAKFLSVTEVGSPTDAESFFTYMSSLYGPPRGQGTIAELDVHYAYYCNNGFGVALFRESSPAPVLWEDESWCVRDLQAIDIDENGTPEIVYFDSGGGTGVYVVKEIHVSWPKGQARPALGFEYRSFEMESYFNQDFEVEVEKVVTREMQYGQDCHAESYCPSWPLDAQCRPAVACEIAQEGTLQVMGDVFPPRLRSDPEWRAYVKELASEGIVLTGAEVPADLSELSLESLDAVDSGERPKLTEERKKMVEDWLN